VGNLF